MVQNERDVEELVRNSYKLERACFENKGTQAKGSLLEILIESLLH
jgi:hypothetical protein